MRAVQADYRGSMVRLSLVFVLLAAAAGAAFFVDTKIGICGLGACVLIGLVCAQVLSMMVARKPGVLEAARRAYVLAHPRPVQQRDTQLSNAVRNAVLDLQLDAVDTEREAGDDNR